MITAENAPRVLGYLGTTRRWRTGGMVLVPVLVTVLQAVLHQHTSETSLLIFVGWFIGALIAEWRVGTGQRDGVRRAASLVPRRLSDYVGRVVPVVVVAAYLFALAGQAFLWLRLPVARTLLALLIAITVVSAAAIAWVVQQVLQRPQALGPQDVLLADDALRSRSLHVLFGSGLAIAGTLASAAQSSASQRAYSALRAFPTHTPANPRFAGEADWYPASAHGIVQQYHWIEGGYAAVTLFCVGVTLLVLGVFVATATFRAERQTALAPAVA